MKLKYDPNVVLDAHRWKQDGMTLKADIINGLDFSFVPQKTINSTIGTTTNRWAFGGAGQRYAFPALGRFWVFYSDGTNFVWKTTTDGIAWSAATTLRASWNAGYLGSIWFDGTYVHYVFTTTAAGDDVLYRMYLVNSDGTLTAQAAEQIAVAIGASQQGSDPQIAVDSNGFPWIVAPIRTTATNEYYAWIAKSSTKDGTWTDETVLFTSPYQFSASLFDAPSGIAAWGVAIPLSGGQMYAMIQPSWTGTEETRIRGRLWDGSAWGTEETVAAPTDAILNASISPVVDSQDNIILTYTDYDSAGAGTRTGYFTIRTARTGLWGTPAIMRTPTAEGVIGYTCIDPNDIVYHFYQTDPTVRHIYYRRYVNGAWEAVTDWITETQAFGDEYGSYQSAALVGALGRIIYTYVTLTASPFNVKMAVLEQEGRIPPWLFHGNQVGRDFNKDSKFNSP